MNELLKKLLESEVLSPETKTQLEEAVSTQMQELVEQTKAATEERVRVDLAEQWLQTRDTLIEAIDTKVTDFLAEELKELHQDIDTFRDLEVEYASKLTEAKVELAATLQEEMAQLLEMLNTFLESRITDEFNELREDITAAKKADLGNRVFESFAKEYAVHFIDGSEAQRKLKEAEDQLAAVTAKLNEAAQVRTKLERSAKMESVLTPLSGVQRELMETILSTVNTGDLEKTYNKFIGRILKEAVAPVTAIVTESAEKTIETVVKTGDVVTESIVEEATKNAATPALIAELQRLAGIRL